MYLLLPCFGLNCLCLWPSGGHSVVFVLFRLMLSVGIPVLLRPVSFMFFLGYFGWLVTLTAPFGL